MMPTSTDPGTNASPLDVAGASRSATWRWYICVLLLLATVVNYMDRLTTNSLAKEIKTEFRLDNEQYGDLELGFGVAFAVGSLFFGWAADRIGVYWLYPAVLVGWSAMGFLTGLSRDFSELWMLRVLLGFFESGHFPCGLMTIQQLLAPRDRAMGSSLLQSGTALGAVLAPQAIKLFMTEGIAGWRRPFLVIGASGTAWVVLWFCSMRPRDLRPRPSTDPAPAPTAPPRVVAAARGEPEETFDRTFLQVVASRRFLALAIMVVCVNLNWHFFRVWLPLYLRDVRNYDRDAALNFSTFYYMAADLGVLVAGAFSGYLARRGLSVFASRMWVFGGCCLLTTLTTAAAFLPSGPWLLGALLLVGFGGLGTFAAYYSMTQDLSRRHQGKVSGGLATITWLTTAPFHKYFGRYLDETKDYNLALGLVGWMPMIALVAVLLLWNRGRGTEDRT